MTSYYCSFINCSSINLVAPYGLTYLCKIGGVKKIFEGVLIFKGVIIIKITQNNYKN